MLFSLLYSARTFDVLKATGLLGLSNAKRQFPPLVCFFFFAISPRSDRLKLPAFLFHPFKDDGSIKDHEEAEVVAKLVLDMRSGEGRGWRGGGRGASGCKIFVCARKGWEGNYGRRKHVVCLVLLVLADGTIPLADCTQ